MKENQHINQIIKNIETCMEQNYFKFNNKVYKQSEKLLMGLSL